MKLATIVKNKIKSLENSERSLEAYQTPTWAYAQADNNGSIRALKQIATLLAFVKEDK